MKAILRVGKVRGSGSVGSMAGHHNRSRQTLNAMPLKGLGPRFLIGSGNPAADVQRRYEAAGCKQRKNGVTAVEVFLSASPEFFRPHAPLKYGTFSVNRVQSFCRKALPWAQDHFGEDNIVSAALHIDEATPHLHLTVTPIVVANGKARQSARTWLNGKVALSKMQDSFAAAVAELGLRRGQRNSKAHHKEVSEWYGEQREVAAQQWDKAAEMVEQGATYLQLQERAAQIRNPDLKLTPRQMPENLKEEIDKRFGVEFRP